MSQTTDDNPTADRFRALPDRWQDREIVNDRRIDHEDPRVRAVAERLHANESMHLHLHVGDSVCVYCALRASHAVREMDRLNA